MSVQCTVCYAIHDTTPVNKDTGKVLLCNQCPCHADPNDAKREVGKLSNHPRESFRGIPAKPGRYFQVDMVVMCPRRCRNTVYRPYAGTTETADKPITPRQHYGMPDITPELTGTVWQEGCATVASTDDAGNTRFFKLKVRISDTGTGYKVRVWLRDKRVWEDRDKAGFNPAKALSKGTWVTVASIGDK